MNAQRTLAPALGWLSVALGATQLTMPHQLSRAIGTNDGNSILMRSLGVRELGAGVAVLSRRKPAPGLWARVAGDAMDIALLASAMRSGRNDRTRLGLTMATIAAITAADVVAAMAPSDQPDVREAAKPLFTKTVSILASREGLFQLLRDEGTLHLAPGFDQAELSLQRSTEPESIVWHVKGARAFSGTLDISLSEQPDDKGTSVCVRAYPDGLAMPAKLLRRAFGEFPGDEFALGLHRLKNIAEVGYVVSAESPSARESSKVGAAS